MKSENLILHESFLTGNKGKMIISWAIEGQMEMKCIYILFLRNMKSENLILHEHFGNSKCYDCKDPKECCEIEPNPSKVGVVFTI
jgi:hypothetical protein